MDRLSFYNDLECARDIGVANGVPPTAYHLVNASQEDLLANVAESSADFVFSLWSCGWHYPVEQYVRAIATIVKPDTGRILLMVRHDLTWQKDLLKAAGLTCTHQTLLSLLRSRKKGDAAGYALTCFKAGKHGANMWLV